MNNNAWCNVRPLDNIGYDYNTLCDAVMTFNGTGAVGLIVTVGGVVSAVPALRCATKPFLSLIGGTTADFKGTIEENFYGGVTLHTFADNDKRVDHLTKPPHRLNPNQICLLSNPGTSMATTEMELWRAATPLRGRIITASNETEIARAFPDFKNDGALLAMIISADAYFQDHKDAVIAGANGSGKHICYPLQIYANTGRPHTPAIRRHTLHGPKLATAYYSLGQKAATVISSGNRSTLDSAPAEVHDR